MLRLLQSLPLIVILMGAGTIATLIPGLHAFAMRDNAVGRGFLYSAAIMAFGVTMLAIVTQGRPASQSRRAPLITLVVIFVVLPMWLALPFMVVMKHASPAAAWFEMVSAFSTTGMTLWADTTRLPASVHLWRAMVGWSGGAFILIVAASILGPMNLGGREVAFARVSGAGHQSAIAGGPDPVRRFLNAAAVIGPVYCGLTIVLWAGLLILGEPGLDGLCLAMSSLSTSGITCGSAPSTGGSGVSGEALICLFLLFSLSRRLLPGPAVTDRAVPLWREPELRLAAGILVLVPSVLLVRHWLGSLVAEGQGDAVAALHALWGAVFATLSFLTTTGFIPTDWNNATAWSGLTTPGLILLGLAILGGGVATTAGGVKLLRVYALMRHGERELGRIIHPSSVGGEGRAARRLRREGAYFAWIFFMLFAMSIAVVMLGLTTAGLEFQSALVLGIAALTTTGPLVSVAATAPIDLGALSGPAQFLAGAAMILGRIEVLAVIALFSWTGQRR
jgi:trk system potassium uptake protein